MKKLSIAIVIILGFSQLMKAQDIKFGAKAGLNLANMSGDVEDNSMKLAFHLGGMAEIKISEQFAVQPELLYSAQGAKFSDGTLSLNYLALPVMAKYAVTENFSIEAGPQFGYLLSAKAKDTSNDNSEPTYEATAKSSSSNKAQAVQANSRDIKENFKSFDLGLALGGSYLLGNGMNVGVRYIMGLSNTPKNDDGDFKYKNSVFQLSLGYYFN
ncbi:porin family protein [Mariniflexile sp.]|uniref:porin family protein n=1 Tax=Mariniflexile sp. TaxID=1979402 RepID=UPI004047B862